MQENEEEWDLNIRKDKLGQDPKKYVFKATSKKDLRKKIQEYNKLKKQIEEGRVKIGPEIY